MKTSQIISVANRKGGNGKTTVTRNLGELLAKRGYTVLLVDFDPQANLSAGFGVRKAKSPDGTISKLMWPIMDGDAPEKQDWEESIIRFGGIDLIPSSEYLSVVERYLVESLQREYVLKKVLESLWEKYDYVLVDCGPSFGQLFINALAASDSVLIVANAAQDSLDGIEKLLENMALVQKGVNPDVIPDGILFNNLDPRLNDTQRMLGQAEERFGQRLSIYSAKIPHSTIVDKARSTQQCVEDFDPESKAATAFRIFCKEFLRKRGELNGKADAIA